MKMRFALILAAALCVSSLPTWAGIIYSDFGAGYNYDDGYGWSEAGASSGAGLQATGSGFTAAISGSVTAIDAALGWISGDGGATASLWTDAGDLSRTLCKRPSVVDNSPARAGDGGAGQGGGV